MSPENDQSTNLYHGTLTPHGNSHLIAAISRAQRQRRRRSSGCARAGSRRNRETSPIATARADG